MIIFISTSWAAFLYGLQEDLGLHRLIIGLKRPKAIGFSGGQEASCNEQLFARCGSLCCERPAKRPKLSLRPVELVMLDF